MPGQIAVGVDGSDESLAAVDWAADEAALRDAGLRLVNASLWQEHPIVAVQPARDELAERARSLLGEMEERARARRPGLATTAEEIEDAPTRVLLAAGADAEMLVLGSHGFGAAGGFLFGSVGQEVVAQAERPVVLVRHGDGTRPGEPGDGRVVLGLDLKHPADEVIDFAADFAARHSAPLHIVHSWRLAALHHRAVAESDAGAKAEQQLTTAVSDAVRPYRDRFPQMAVDEQVVSGRSGRRLVEAAAGARLLVVGRHRGHEPRTHIGSTTHAVIHHAPCPVAVVPHG
ncbi:universal stress protein [Streptomyces sp. MUM 178J]|uniref:universal stress protein n=1 Tax=Streptomyces sp. MUM 178J TaxID=2791991 RepID=UPI001F044D80|nr:universal stress protein [Streptomyces sp. MUM 178J]WRQ78182.1 universal stress protein [Streptomyces sp. MUM 178J]